MTDHMVAKGSYSNDRELQQSFLKVCVPSTVHSHRGRIHTARLIDHQAESKSMHISLALESLSLDFPCVWKLLFFVD